MTLFVTKQIELTERRCRRCGGFFAAEQRSLPEGGRCARCLENDEGEACQRAEKLLRSVAGLRGALKRARKGGL